MYFVKRGDTYNDVTGASFKDLLKGALPQMRGERAVLSDWANHISTIFPEVRMKRYLEMRGADSGSISKIVAMSSFFTGLLYDNGVLDEAYELVKDITYEQALQARNDVPKLGFKAKMGKRSVHELAKASLALAEKGLKRRNFQNAQGQDESLYLDAIRTSVEAGRTPAEELLARYHGAWGSSVLPVFDENVY
jgi:glutamate--cysteine ligase